MRAHDRCFSLFFRERRLVFHGTQAPPIEILHEGLWSSAEALRKYLNLEDVQEQGGASKREGLMNRRLDQAILTARSHRLQLDERMLVARTVRERLQIELETIEKSLKGTIADQLKDLANRQRMTVTRKLNEVNALLKELQEQRGQMPFMDRMKMHGEEMIRDFRESDWKVKAGYIVGLGVGFLFARWVYRKIRGAFTESKEQGVLSRILGWFAGIGGAVGGLFGAKKIADAIRYPDDKMRQVVATTTAAPRGAAAEVSRLSEPVVNAGAEAVAGLTSAGRAIYELANGNLDQAKKAAVETLKHGGAVFYEGGSFVCRLAKDAIDIPVKYTTEIGKFMESEGSWTDLLYVHGEGFTVYVMGATVLRKILTGSARIGASTLIRGVAWPVFTVKNGVHYVVGWLHPDTRELIKLKTYKGWQYRYEFGAVKRAIKRFRSTANPEEVEYVVRRFVAFHNAQHILETESGGVKSLLGIADEADVGRYGTYMSRTARRLQKALNGVDKLSEDAPEFLKQLYAKKDIPIKDFEEFLRKEMMPLIKQQQAARHAARSAGAADEVMESAADAARAKLATAAAGAAEETSEAIAGRVGPRRPVSTVNEGGPVRAASDAAEAAPSRAPLKVVGGVDDTMNALRTLDGMSDLSDDVLRAIASDAKLAGAIEKAPPACRTAIVNILKSSPDAANTVTVLSKIASTDDGVRVLSAFKTEQAIAKLIADSGDIVKISKTARALRLAGRVGGVGLAGLDAAGIYFTLCEIGETTERIRQTPDSSRELKSLYYQRYGYHAMQLGVCTTGAATSVMFVAGVGTTVAGPVALATIPISAILYAAYEGHLRKEAKTRTEKDWTREYDLPTIIADARTYGFGERVGDAWELGGGWTMLVPTLMPLNLAKNPQRLSKFVEDLRSMNREMIEAITLHTTTVTVPTKMREIKDGIPVERLLNADEKSFYERCAKTYFNAKVQYLLEKQQDIAHAVSSGANIADLLNQSESYARLEHDRFVAKEKNLTLTFPDSGKSKEDQAEEYGGTLRRTEAEQLLASSILQMALLGEEATPNLEQSFADLLTRRSLPFETYFSVRSQEGNYKDWWLDGKAPQILSLHLQAESRKIVGEEAKKLATFTVSTIEALERVGDAPQRTELHRTVTENIERALDDSTRRLEKHFVSRTPREMWDGLSDPRKEQIEEYLEHVSDLQEIEKELENATYEIPFKDPKSVQTLRRKRAWQHIWLTQHPLMETPAASPSSEQTEAPLEGLDRLRKEAGMKLFKERGIQPGPDGIHTFNADSAPKVTALYYRYAPADGWQWSPDRENWQTVNSLKVLRGPFKDASPTKPNQDFIDQLRQASHPNHIHQ